MTMATDELMVVVVSGGSGTGDGANQTANNNNNDKDRNSFVYSSSSSEPSSNRFDSSSSSLPADKSEFSVIWQNLTYKVDSRHWHTKLRERLSGNNTGADNLSPDNLNDSRSSDIESVPRRCERTILNSICGDVKSGQLTAILGPSGAGKSSLLYCLFQNRTQGTTGRILVDAQSKKKLKVCFIPQKDYLNEWLTVREDLIFVSKLRSAKVSILRESSELNLPGNNLDQQTLGASSTYVKQCGKKRCSTTHIDHDENAIRVAELLGITNCLDVPIRRISGGQKKRLSVARELMSTPDILILDEPTTGLDSLTCHKTISVLKDLARLSPHPMAVIVTIHQPQRSVFNQFDRTYFLSNRGRVVYDGRPQDVVDTLLSVANMNLPAAKSNPAASLIEISSDREQTHIVELLSTYQQTKFDEKYEPLFIKRLMRTKREIKREAKNVKQASLSPRGSIQSNTGVGDIQTLQEVGLNSSSMEPNFNNENTIVSADNSPMSLSTNNTDEYFISRQLKDCLNSNSDRNILRSIRHIFILTHRSWLANIRNPNMTRSRLMFHAALPLIMLIIFGTKSGGPNSCPVLDGAELDINSMRKSMHGNVVAKNIEETRLALENISLFFVLLYGFAMNIISTTASYYPLTIHMFKKETINGLYTSGPYLIGQTLAELPLEILFPSISVILLYSLSGQIASAWEWRMFAITLVVFLLCYSIHSLGLLYGSLFINDINVAVLVGQITLFPPVILSGFLIRTPYMPPWMLNLSRFSFFQHSLKAIAAARYGFNVCECDEDMLPEPGESVKFSGMPSNVKHVIDYMFPKNETDGIVVGDVFDKMGGMFSKAQTFSINITSCEDVKPYAMTAFDVEDRHLLQGVVALIFFISVLKVITFSIVRLTPYRID